MYQPIGVPLPSAECAEGQLTDLDLCMYLLQKFFVSVLGYVMPQFGVAPVDPSLISSIPEEVSLLIACPHSMY